MFSQFVIINILQIIGLLHKNGAVTLD